MDHETGTGVPLKEDHEQDALTGWPKVTRFRPGGRKAAKTTLNRRCQTVEIEEADQAPRALRSFSRQRALPNCLMDGQSGALGVILRGQPEVVESRTYTPISNASRFRARQNGITTVRFVGRPKQKRPVTSPARRNKAANTDVFRVKTIQRG